MLNYDNIETIKARMVGHMSKTQRRAAIVEFVDEKGQVGFGELKLRFPDVSDMTLRTDLRDLDTQKKLIRVHGGARTVKASVKANDSFFLRETCNLDRRQIIARKAAVLLQSELSKKPNVSIYLDCGVTITEIAKRFPDEWCSIVTNSISAAYMLSSLKRPSVTVLGGMLNRINCSCDSIRNMEELERMNFDITFLPTAGFSVDTAFTCGKEVMDDMRWTVIKHSKKIIVPMDSSKVGKIFQITHLRLEDVDMIISDDELPEDIKQLFISNGIEVL
jgi:DeoR family transcriptional regulator of aga operon